MGVFNRRSNLLAEAFGGALSFVRLFQPLEQPDSGTHRPAIAMKCSQNPGTTLSRSADSHVRPHSGGNRSRIKLSALRFWKARPAKTAINLGVCAWLIATGATGLAQSTWQEALSRMPLETNTTELNRTN